MTERSPSPESIEAEIERLLGQLDRYALDQFPEEIQDDLEDDWYACGHGATQEVDRQKALENLRWFLDKLARTPKRSE